MNASGGRVAVVFRGDVDAPLNPRLEPMADALLAAGVEVERVGFHPDHRSEVEQRLSGLGRGDGVLVWADPLGDEGDRTVLDSVLRKAEAAGAWVSARPDVIDRLGTKEVLVTTRGLGWGSDTHVYRDSDSFRREFPRRLAADRVRVLKAARGNGGRTVWKVSLAEAGPLSATPGPDVEVVVQHARARDGAATPMTLAGLTELVEDGEGVFTAWGGTGCLVDQEFVPGITRGIVRCYLVGGTVVGFARQYPDGVLADGPLDVVPETQVPPEEVMGLPSPKTMYQPQEPAFADLRERVEADWVPGMASVLGLKADDLPALWDIDLLVDSPSAQAGDQTRSGPDPRFVLCEINASSIIPFPPQAPARVAHHVVAALAR